MKPKENVNIQMQTWRHETTEYMEGRRQARINFMTSVTICNDFRVQDMHLNQK